MRLKKISKIKVRKTSKSSGVCGYAGAVLRGGNWNNDVNSGVFATNLNNAPSNTNTNIGFRCVFVPGLRFETGLKFWRARFSFGISKLTRNSMPLGNFSLSFLGHASKEGGDSLYLGSKKLLFFILLIFSFHLSAGEIDRILKNDDLMKIAQRNIHKVKNAYGDRVSDYAEDIKKWNPNISDWKTPPTNQFIYISYPYSPYVTGISWASPLGVYKEPHEFKREVHLSFYYASSFGNYTEQTSEQNVKSGQNFPVTFGLATGISDEKKENFFVTSVYVAQSSKGEINGNSEASNSEVSIPGEVGINLYYQRFNVESEWGFFGGYDYESLNTFNTNEIITGSPVENVNNQLHYATLGVVKNFDLLNMDLSLKASLSRILLSRSGDGHDLSGNRYFVNLTYKPEGRFSFGVFYKRHILKGSTDLTIDRIGARVGIFVF